MIAWVDRLLVSWAECVRLGGGDLAGLGYPSGSGPAVVAELSRVRRSGADKRTAAVLRAGLSAGATAHGVATRSSRVANRAPMRGDVDKLDRFVAGHLDDAERRLLEVFYVDDFHTRAEKAGMLGCAVCVMYRRVDGLHLAIDRYFRPNAVLREEARLNAVELERLMVVLSA